MASVLVVDDDAELRTLLSNMLLLLGHEVSEAENGQQGLKTYQAQPANVVLLDMFMPVKDGIETMRDLKRHDPNVRVIAMTGGGMFGQVAILKSAITLGACKILYKPITVNELRSAVEKTLEMPAFAM
jgi:DNA-binding NtrC family response regulator